MSLLKGVFRFVSLTLALGFLGTALIATGSAAGPTPAAPNLATILGVFVLLLSPLLSAGWLWWRRRASKAAAVRLAAALQAEAEQHQQDLLRLRFIERQRLIDAVDRHRAALERNLARACRRNDYGALVEDRTGEALVEFFASISLDATLIPFAEARDLVFEQLDFRKAEQTAAGFDAASIPFDGHDFERWVAEALNGFGWKAEVTRGSGDQGLDVIAERQGKRIGLQCKLYGTPVGNKAVQEAHAGKVYYGVDAVGVLSNASFTPSATALALVTGVKLFSHHDIPDLFEKAFAMP